jgi:hypothetical protein
MRPIDSDIRSEQQGCETPEMSFSFLVFLEIKRREVNISSI